MQVVALLVRDEWGSLQRVLGLLTRKRVHVEAMLATPQAADRTLRVLLGSGDVRFSQMLPALRRLDPVQEAVLLEGWSDVLWAIPTGLRPSGQTPETAAAGQRPAVSSEGDAHSSTSVHRDQLQP